MSREIKIHKFEGNTQYSVHVIDSYGETHTNYFETERRCREHIYYTWENEVDPLAKERAEHWRDDLLTNAIEECIEMDREAGITSENNDCLD